MKPYMKTTNMSHLQGYSATRWVNRKTVKKKNNEQILSRDETTHKYPTEIGKQIITKDNPILLLPLVNHRKESKQTRLDEPIC